MFDFKRLAQLVSKKAELGKLKARGALGRANPFRNKQYDINNATSSRVVAQGQTEEKIPDNKKDEPLESFHNIDSTAIKDAKYNSNTGDMSIKFRGGSKYYVYPNVPEEVADGFRTAKSKGRYFQSEIKPYSINA